MHWIVIHFCFEYKCTIQSESYSSQKGTWTSCSLVNPAVWFMKYYCMKMSITPRFSCNVYLRIFFKLHALSFGSWYISDKHDPMFGSWFVPFHYSYFVLPKPYLGLLSWPLLADLSGAIFCQIRSRFLRACLAAGSRQSWTTRRSQSSWKMAPLSTAPSLERFDLTPLERGSPEILESLLPPVLL